MIRTGYKTYSVILKSRYEARKHYERVKTYGYIVLFLSVFLFFMFPPLAFSLWGIYFAYFLYNFYDEYFGFKHVYYKKNLTPLMTARHYVQVGYEVYPDSEVLDDFLSIFKQDNKTIKEELKKRERAARKKPWEIVGLDKDHLTRHFLIVGSTGAGKTSLIMTLLNAVMPVGGGAIFIDGKADSAMMMKFWAIAERSGRVHDCFVINLLMPDKSWKDTNTISVFASLSATGQVVFLSTLAASGEMTGDASYWLGRGRALLTPVVQFNYFRKQFYGEPYSYETISQYLSANEFGFATTCLYVMAKAINDRIKQDKKLKRILQAAKRSMTPTSEVPELEALVSYIIQNPYITERVEKAGYSRFFLDALYGAYSSAMTIYLKTLSTKWTAVIKKISEAYYEYLQKKRLDPLVLSITEFRETHAEFIEEYRGRGEEQAQEVELYYSPPDKDVEQHQYAQQQWSEVLQTLGVYKNVFGASDPDVDMLDILKNARFLYVLLPSLYEDPKGRELLGKVFVTIVKSTCAFSLGGRIEGFTDVQQKILSQILKPIPLGLVILDEYGAYPVPELDVILAQTRSLNISTFIAVQDLTSLRVGGTSENSLKRALANTNKFVLKTSDEETVEYLRKLVPEEHVAVEQSITEMDDVDYEKEFQVSFNTQPVFDPKNAVAFEKGFGLALVDGRMTYFQSFYVDTTEAKRLTLNRFEPLVGV